MECGSRVSQGYLNSPGDRVRAAEHASSGPFRPRERRHGLADIVRQKLHGRFAESPLPFLISWFFFGLSNLLTHDGRLITDEPLRWLILANCVAQSIDAGIFIQSALYEQSMERKTKWSIPFVLLFIALAINVGKSANGLAIFLTLPGAFLIVLGQKTVFGDRKRGDYWMQTGKVNPDPIVYSYGELFFMTGWILFSLAMSIAV